jgi:signal transduction histidine kinase
MDSPTMDSAQQVVLILTPFDDDVDDLAASAPEGTSYQRCLDLPELTKALRALGSKAGAVVAAEEAFEDEAIEDLSTMLAGQPAWSSIPFLLLAGGQADGSLPNKRLLDLLDNTQPILLDRPVRTGTLARNLRSCLNARRRQRQIRDQLQIGRILRRKDRPQALARAQEIERKRIAGELHDDFAQRMAILSMQLDRLALSPPGPEEVTSHIQSVKAHVEQLCDDLRDLSHRLHPALLDILGLTAVLQVECERASKVIGFPVRFESDPAAEDLSPEMALAIYRVVQEALRNSAKHAEAGQASVTLSIAGAEVHLKIEDDGKGFDPEAAQMCKGGLGLLSMAERLELFDGRLSIDSQLGQGTRIRAIVPLGPAASKRDRDSIAAEDPLDSLGQLHA